MGGGITGDGCDVVIVMILAMVVEVAVVVIQLVRVR